MCNFDTGKRKGLVKDDANYKLCSLCLFVEGIHNFLNVVWVSRNIVAVRWVRLLHTRWQSKKFLLWDSPSYNIVQNYCIQNIKSCFVSCLRNYYLTCLAYFMLKRSQMCFLLRLSELGIV